MYAHERIVLILALVLSLFLVLIGVVLGQGGDEEIALGLDGGGGGASSAGRYTLTDSVGQPAASDPPSSDGSRYEWSDGFWQAHKAFGESTIYLPLVVRDGP